MDNETNEKSMKQFESNCQHHQTKDELFEHAKTMAVLYIGLIHGIAGKGFTDGFLAGSLADENRVVVLPEKLQ